MTDKPKRRFWQIHLSTGVLLMIGIGVILGVSMRYAKAPVLIPEELYSQNPTAVKNIVDRENGVRFIRILFGLPIAIVMLLLIGIVFEWLIRRRESRKT